MGICLTTLYEVDFASHQVPFPATSDQRSRVAGNGRGVGGKEQWIALCNKPVELNNDFFYLCPLFHSR